MHVPYDNTLLYVNSSIQLFCSHVSADIPAQIYAPTSGAQSGGTYVLSLPWCPDVYAHAATYAGWANGP